MALCELSRSYFVDWIYSQMVLVTSPDQRTTDGATPENAVFGNWGPHSEKTTSQDLARETGLVRRDERAVGVSLISRGLLSLQIRCVQRRRRVRCAKQRPKSEILVKTVPSCVHAGHTRRGGQVVPASYQIDKARRLVIS